MNEKQYRIERNLKHNGTDFTPGQVVTGFTPEQAERLVAGGTISEYKNEQPAEIVQLGPKPAAATVVGGAEQTPPASLQQASVIGAAPVAPPAAPAAPAPGTPGGRPLTPQEQAVANTAAQVQ